MISGGAGGIRTRDLFHAKETRSHCATAPPSVAPNYRLAASELSTLSDAQSHHAIGTLCPGRLLDPGAAGALSSPLDPLRHRPWQAQLPLPCPGVARHAPSSAYTPQEGTRKWVTVGLLKKAASRNSSKSLRTRLPADAQCGSRTGQSHNKRGFFNTPTVPILSSAPGAGICCMERRSRSDRRFCRDGLLRPRLRRARVLEAQGVRVLRFWNNEVLAETEAVLETIWNALTQTLSQGERG